MFAISFGVAKAIYSGASIDVITVLVNPMLEVAGSLSAGICHGIHLCRIREMVPFQYEAYGYFHYLCVIDSGACHGENGNSGNRDRTWLFQPAGMHDARNGILQYL